MANETINWYPGHMKKATRMMEDSLRLVDAVVELRDARIPNSSRNPDVERIVGSKPRLIVLNRADQADAAAEEWLQKNPQKLQPRFDVIEIYAPDGVDTKKPDIRHWENAFTLD